MRFPRLTVSIVLCSLGLACDSRKRPDADSAAQAENGRARRALFQQSLDSLAAARSDSLSAAGASPARSVASAPVTNAVDFEEPFWKQVDQPPETHDSVACDALPPVRTVPTGLRADAHPRPVAQTRGKLHILASAMMEGTRVQWLVTASERAEGELQAVATPCVLGLAIPEHSVLRALGDTLILASAGRTARLVGSTWSRGADEPMPDAPPLGAIEPWRRRAAIRDRDSAGRTRWWVIGPPIESLPEADVRAGVVEVVDTAAQSYLPPNPSFEQFERVRPKRVSEGYDRGTIFVNSVGAYQQVGRELWFGSAFYDGEGRSGLGGIGRFDLDRRTYAMMWSAGSSDASVSAILVDPPFVTVGLASQCECGEPMTRSAAFYDLVHGTTTPIRISGMVTAIGRAGTSVMLLSTTGLYRTERVSDVVAVPISLQK